MGEDKRKWHVAMATPSPKEGIGVDSMGNPTVDPSPNVQDLNEATNKRQDDLREAYEKLFESKIQCANEKSELRAKHQEFIDNLRERYREKIARAESGRLDSIRQVDREEVVKTAAGANTAITTLATNTTNLATTLQKQVQETAAAAETRYSASYAETNKRISALELSSSEGKGKQTVVDPQMDKLTALVEMLARNQDRGSGKTEGVDKTWQIVAVIGTIVISIAGVGIAFAVFNRTPAPIYLSAPPTNIPQQNNVPR